MISHHDPGTNQCNQDNHIERIRKNPNSTSLPTHHFLFGAQHAQLAKAHVEGGALVGAISLADHHHIDAARQRGLVDAFVQLLDSHQHLAGQLAHVVHGVRLEGRGVAECISQVIGSTK